MLLTLIYWLQIHNKYGKASDKSYLGFIFFRQIFITETCHFKQGCVDLLDPLWVEIVCNNSNNQSKKQQGLCWTMAHAQALMNDSIPETTQHSEITEHIYIHLALPCSLKVHGRVILHCLFISWNVIRCSLIRFSLKFRKSKVMHKVFCPIH